MSTAESLGWFLPELALAAAILGVIFLDLLTTGRAGQRPSEWPGKLALVGAGLALVCTVGLRTFGIQGLVGQSTEAWLFNGMIVLDPFSVFFKVLLALALLAVVWMSMASREVRGQPSEGEYY